MKLREHGKNGWTDLRTSPTWLTGGELETAEGACVRPWFEGGTKEKARATLKWNNVPGGKIYEGGSFREDVVTERPKEKRGSEKKKKFTRFEKKLKSYSSASKSGENLGENCVAKDQTQQRREGLGSGRSHRTRRNRRDLIFLRSGAGDSFLRLTGLRSVGQHGLLRERGV